MGKVRQKTSPILFLMAMLSWMGFILYLSSQPSSFYEDHLAFWPERFRELMEYPAHFSLYFLLFQLSKGLLFSLGDPPGERKALLAAILLTGSFGMVDELYQSTVPTRSCDPKDFLVDGLAALSGALLHQLLSRRVALLPSAPSRQGTSPGTEAAASRKEASTRSLP